MALQGCRNLIQSSARCRWPSGCCAGHRTSLPHRRRVRLCGLAGDADCVGKALWLGLWSGRGSQSSDSRQWNPHRGPGWGVFCARRNGRTRSCVLCVGDVGDVALLKQPLLLLLEIVLLLLPAYTVAPSATFDFWTLPTKRTTERTIWTQSQTSVQPTAQKWPSGYFWAWSFCLKCPYMIEMTPAKSSLKVFKYIVPESVSATTKVTNAKDPNGYDIIISLDVT